ncbi:cupin domain-containing protein [Streptomyces sparsus]
MTTRNSGSHGPSGGTPAARVVCDTSSLAELDPAPAGALWRLSEPGRQLDANVVHIPPARRVDTHCEPDLDVLLLVVAGDGTLLSAEGPRALRQGSLAWLPHGSTRGLVAGELGLSYLTVHTRRPGMRIRPSDAGS